MKTYLTLALLSASLVLSAAGASAQPTPIASLPYVISEPGSYLVETTLRDSKGITIITSHVTLDLGGFALLGDPDGSGDGILVRGKQRDIEIRNGTIAGWGKRGIMADDATNASYYGLRISGNGLCGLRGGSGAVVENVEAEHNEASGLVAFGASLITDSISAGNVGWGMEVGEAGVVRDVTVLSNGAGGIFAGPGSRIAGNAVRENGWLTSEGSSACFVATLAGITAQGSGSRFEDNVVTGNTIGLQLLESGNSVRGNLVKENGDNYDFAPDNMLELVLGELPEDIEWPAAVTLAGTLTGAAGENGINIYSDDVTIDLGGHTLQGVTDSMCGVKVHDSHRNIVVKNGISRDWGGCGVNLENADNARVQGMTTLGNQLHGVRVGEGSEVRDSVARESLLDGISTLMDGLVVNSVATGNAGDGIQVGPHSMILDSVASENTRYGFYVQDGSTVRDCTASGNLRGIEAGSGCRVVTNAICLNTEIGIVVGGRSTVSENNCHLNGVGISTFANGNRIEANNLADNTVYGLQIAGQRSIIMRNSFSNNATEYLIAANNAFGEVVDVAGAGDFTADAWCNFVY